MKTQKREIMTNSRQNVQYGPSSRPGPVLGHFLFNVIIFRATKVAWFLVFRPAEFWVYSYYILCARRGDAEVGEFGFPENVFFFTVTRITWFNSSLYFIGIGPKWANSWHKERRVIKLSVKYKLLLACFILWPKFTPQYFLSTFAYLPILGHSARRQH